MKYLLLSSLLIVLSSCGKETGDIIGPTTISKTVCTKDFLLENNQVFDVNKQLLPNGIYQASTSLQSPSTCVYKILNGDVILMGYTI